MSWILSVLAALCVLLSGDACLSPQPPPPQPKTYCGEGTFGCSTNRNWDAECLPKTHGNVCDGVQHCVGGEDEYCVDGKLCWGIICNNFTSPSDLICYNDDHMCNSVQDCVSGEDERGCIHTEPVKKPVPLQYKYKYPKGSSRIPTKKQDPIQPSETSRIPKDPIEVPQCPASLTPLLGALKKTICLLDAMYPSPQGCPWIPLRKALRKFICSDTSITPKDPIEVPRCPGRGDG